jgi:hypothetical protein
MQKSYVAKTTINFVDFEFYVRPGDLLVHDTSNHNRLTVYRNGQIVKVVKQGTLGIVAFLKNKFIEEVAPVAPPDPVQATKPTPEPVRPSKEELAAKRRKMHGEEVSVNELPKHLREIVESRETKTETTVESAEK